MNVDLGKGKLPAINSPTVNRNKMNQTSLWMTKQIRTQISGEHMRENSNSSLGLDN
jgi:hypothetical protein